MLKLFKQVTRKIRIVRRQRTVSLAFANDTKSCWAVLNENGIRRMLLVIVILANSSIPVAHFTFYNSCINLIKSRTVVPWSFGPVIFLSSPRRIQPGLLGGARMVFSYTIYQPLPSQVPIYIPLVKRSNMLIYSKASCSRTQVSWKGFEPTLRRLNPQNLNSNPLDYDMTPCKHRQRFKDTGH